MIRGTIDTPKYLIIKCPGCGNIQGTSAIKTFSCVRCNKNSLIRKVKIYGGDNNPLVAQALCARINEQRGQNK